MQNQYISIILIVCLAFMSGCTIKGEDPSPLTPQEEQKILLLNNGLSWNLSSITKDGLDVADQFDGFKLVIGDLTYTATNSLPTAWPAQGNWSFANERGTLIERNDGVQVAVEVSTTLLKLTFSVTGLGSGGRAKGVDGEYVLNLVPG
ncbi:MAG: hypothetical protein WAU36_08245 [Cyclobacteriaceae bacterium]